MPNPNLCPLKVGDPKVYSLPIEAGLPEGLCNFNSLLTPAAPYVRMRLNYGKG